MDKTTLVDQLATTDLSLINEIWRGEQVFTHEMMSEGTCGSCQKLTLP